MEKMNLARITFLLLTASLFGGCARQEFQTTFYLNRATFPEDANLETANAVVRSQEFWSRYVAPRLATELARNGSVKDSLRLSLMDGHDGIFSEVRLSVCNATEAELARVAEAVIDGLERYLVAVGGGKEPFVRKSKKA